MDLSCKNCTHNVLAAPAGKIIGVWTIYCFQPFNSQLHVQQRLLLINGENNLNVFVAKQEQIIYSIIYMEREALLPKRRLTFADRIIYRALFIAREFNDIERTTVL